MPERLSTIVVPLDLEPDHDRAIPVAAHLAAVGSIPIQLLTVSSPGLPDQPDRFVLRQLAEKHQLGEWSAVVLHDNEPARAITAHLASLDSPLVVLASSVRGAMSGLFSADTSADILSGIACPSLIIGPNVPDTWRPVHPQLVPCVGRMEQAEIAIAPMARWVNTFGGNTPCFVTVIQSNLQVSERDEVEQSTHLRILADELSASSGISCDWKVLRDDDPVDGVLAFSEKNDDALLVVTSERWPDGSRLHLHSVSRRLAHASTKPVLVIPHAPVPAV